MRFPLRRLVPAALLIAAACSDDGPTGVTAGTEMSVAEQVAIEAALAKVAAALEGVGRTGIDTVMADLTRVAARLVRLQGRQGAITLTGSAVGASATMQGVAMASRQEGLAGPSSAQLVVAWQGLDPVTFTVDRALVVLGGGDGPSWDLAATAATSAARLVEFDGATPTRFFYNASGSLTAGGDDFGGGCPGIDNTADARCETGRQTVAGSVTGSADGGTTLATWAWADAVLPSFRLTTR
ncbi:MAG TPA: hypothetical protein VNA89_10580 [Gemmatimonadaceae bacterium]|nr:hypothetical protein [Gemmatimonadaceae bacterium]